MRVADFATAALFALSLAAALAFSGEKLLFYSISLTTLSLWLGLSLLRRHKNGLPVYLNPLFGILTALLTWFAVSLTWALIPYTAVLNFWWLGALPLAFLAFVWDPDSANAWPRIRRLAVALALAGALFAVYQSQQGESPSALFLNKNNHAAFINLLLLPLAASLITRVSPGARQVLHAGIIIVFLTVMFLVASRGALLGLATGLMLLLWGLGLGTHRRGWLLFTALVGIAYLLYIVLEPNAPALTRMASLAEPGSAGASRFLIWETTLEMLREHPIWGIGLGAFWLMYPAFRRPGDASGGYFVHNDYLQLWLEAGFPGLLLTLLVIGTLFVALRSFRQQGGKDPEVYGLTAGLVAVGVHTAFTFNFYLLSILILCGVYFGRLHQHFYPADATWNLSFCRVRPAIFTAFLIGILVPPVTYFVSVALSQHYLESAGEITTKNFAAADRLLARAQKLTPTWEAISSARADLRRAALAHLQGKAAADTFKTALAYYREADRLNGFSATPLVGMGRLYSEYPHLAEEADPALVAEHYFLEALRRNPLSIPARRNLAFHYLRQSVPNRALAVLEEGLAYRYPMTKDLVGYYSFASQLYKKFGDERQSEIWGEQSEAVFNRLEKQEVAASSK